MASAKAAVGGILLFLSACSSAFAFVHPRICAATLKSKPCSVPNVRLLPPRGMLLAPQLDLVSATNAAHAPTTPTHLMFSLGDANAPLLSLIDPASQVGDGIRTTIYYAVGFMVVVSILIVLFAQLVLPKQVDTFVEIVKEKDPERWRQLESRLGEGETIMDRPDLMEELADVGVDMIAKEADADTRLLLATVKREKEQTGRVDIDLLGPVFEAKMQMKVEDFVSGIENFDKSDLQDDPLAKRMVTDADRELANILRQEL